MVSRTCIDACIVPPNLRLTRLDSQQRAQVNPIDADDKTEWFEIFNASPDSVNMTGWTIQEATIENTHTMSSFVIGSGQYKVLGRQTNIAGVTVDYVYGLTTSTEGYPQLDNTGDYLLLRDAFTMQDSVNFWSGSNFPGNSESFNAGKSMQLKSLALDNFDGANWCRSTTAWSGAADGDMGTPGQANDCPLNPPPSDSDAQA